MALKEQEYITAARSVGAGARRIMFRHLFPNALPIIIVQATIWLSYAILLEASLSYLGLGVVIPTPSWGTMLRPAARAGRSMVAHLLSRLDDLSDGAFVRPRWRWVA